MAGTNFEILEHRQNIKEMKEKIRRFEPNKETQKKVIGILENNAARVELDIRKRQTVESALNKIKEKRYKKVNKLVDNVITSKAKFRRGKSSKIAYDLRAQFVEKEPVNMNQHFKKEWEQEKHNLFFG